MSASLLSAPHCDPMILVKIIIILTIITNTYNFINFLADNKVKNDDVKIEFNENEDHAKVTFSKEKTAEGPGICTPGPLVISYDVDRENQQAGEILV